MSHTCMDGCAKKLVVCSVKESDNLVIPLDAQLFITTDRNIHLYSMKIDKFEGTMIYKSQVSCILSSYFYASFERINLPMVRCINSQ